MTIFRLLLASLVAFPTPVFSQALVAPVVSPLGGAAAGLGSIGAGLGPNSGLGVNGAQGLGGSASVDLGASLPDYPSSFRGMAKQYLQAEKGLTDSIDAVLAIPADRRTFANTAKALDEAYSTFREKISPTSFMTAVSPDPKVQRMANAIDRRVSGKMISLGDRDDIYQAYKDVAAKGETLTGEDKKILEDTLRAYKRSGMELPAEARAKMNAIRKRLSDLAQAFDDNIKKVDDGIEVTPAELAGLPEDFIAGLKDASDGKKRVTVAYPDFVPFMQLAKDGELRRQLEFKFNNRAVEKNLPLLEEAIGLRQQLAQMLGYKTYVHMASEDRMAKNPETIHAFLVKMQSLLLGPARKDRAALLEEKRREVPGAASVEAWEGAYYSDKLQKRLYDFDPEAARPYFPVDRVIAGTLETYQESLGLAFTEVQAKTWHEDVKLYEVRDKATDKRIGFFYLDLYPRAIKYTHAAAFTVIPGRELPDGTYQPPVSAMVANFTKPTPGKPALLLHDEVETFFHEFGHLMHQVLTTARYTSYSGTSVALDFVEAPSQMLENFVWTPEVLTKVSGHYRDPSRKLPKEMLDKMLAARNFNTALMHLKQVAYATLDYIYHTVPAPVDTTKLMQAVYAMVGVGMPTPGTHFQASFGHLMGGYEAGYVSYLWSKVYAQAIWGRFDKEGVLNPRTGMDYRRSILEKGSTRPEMASMVEFLGGEPTMDAFLKSLGLSPAEPPKAGS